MIYLKQLKSLLTHKYYVLIAGLMVGVPLWRLLIHDWSKFTWVELSNYAQYKYGIKSVSGWAKAWLHHLHHNPHHPEHWLLSWRGSPNFYDDIGHTAGRCITILPMPEVYVREMVADMLGTSREVTGSWDIAAWLNVKGPYIRFHDDTVIILNEIMEEIGYRLTHNYNWSFKPTERFEQWSANN